MNEFFANKKCAIVTGAGEGIGREIAIQLAAEGVKIIINDINQQSAESVLRLIKMQGGQGATVIGDASNSEVIETLVSSAIQEFGRVDIAIANAGITTFGSFLEYPSDNFQELIKVNLFGSFFLAQAVSIWRQNSIYVLCYWTPSASQFGSLWYD
jgi:glucose 1-dehydrogenase